MALLAGAGLLACDGAPLPIDPPEAEPPEIRSAQVTLPEGNVLSALVRVAALNADSAVIVFGTGGALDSTAPARLVAGDTAVIPLLGLLPTTTYGARITAYGPGGSVAGTEFTFTTAALPPDLPAYIASGTDAAPGFVVFAAGSYGLAIDNSGRVVWYHRFTHGPGLNFQALPSGNYAARPLTPDPVDIEPWVELNPLGTVVRTFGCARGLQARFHDVVANPDGTVWLLCDETRVMDLSGVGGQAGALVMGQTVQRVAPTGEALFEWNPFDHFAITDLPLADRLGTTVNFTHGNALGIDADGDLLVSFRSLNEITKISVATGAVRWRMGGLANQFAFDGVAMPPFLGQHGVRPVEDGLLLLDNRGTPGASRAERYDVDEGTRTARLARAYTPQPAATGLLGGSAQATAGGRVLVSIGSGERVAEFDAAGNVVWQLQGGGGYIFRAQRIRSLYAPGRGTSR